MNRSDKTSTTSVAFSRLLTRIAMHSRVKLVDHVQHADLPFVMGLVLDEVIRPDVVGPLRPQPNTRSVVEPEPALLRLLLRHLQPLPSPDPCDPLAVHHPAGTTHHRRDAAIAVAAVLEGERDDVSGKRRLIVTGLGDLALRGAMLAENPACKTLRDAVLDDDSVDASTTTGGAQKFPEAASFRISFSSVRSDTARRSRVFSASRSFSRFTWSPFSPPYS